MNLNDRVKVKLTPTGEFIWTKYWGGEKFGNPDYKFLHPREDGFLHMPCWELFEIFGPHMHMGCNSPFEDNSFHEVQR